MTSKNAPVERRKHKRFRVHPGTYVALGPPYGRVGPMIDISAGGLSFRYVGQKKQADGSHINLFLTEANFYLEKIPIRTILDIEITDRSPSAALKMRRCGLKFEGITDDQASQLNFFIENYSTGKA